ncbi:MAG TPA: VWA domain-containing protein [Acidobacteriaceae bacterium]|nr:VWA domain-containing protein [Acidobacteriaceae bacterium]
MNILYRVWIVFFCLSLPAFAQSGAVTGALTGQSKAESPAASASRHIALDVVVADSSGKPIPGLQQQDFTVLDNKQQQKILSFRAVDTTTTTESPAQIILLIDMVNTSFHSVAYERDQIEKFLSQNDGHLAHPVSMVLFTDTGAQIENGSSQDGHALIATLNKNGTALRSITRSTGFYGAVDRVQLSLNTLRTLASHEATLPGRKIVVWISPGWPLLTGPRIDLSYKDQQGIFNSIAAISTELRQARITLYSVDPLGTSDTGGFRLDYYRTFLKGVAKPTQVQPADLALQVLAYQSGGKVLNASNDVAGEIAACAQDADAYYTLSFDAPPADHVNEYHGLQVILNGKPGLKARTRTGYYAQP